MNQRAVALQPRRPWWSLFRTRPFDRGSGSGAERHWAASEPFRDLVEGVFDALWLCDADGLVRYANPANAPFFGREPSSVEGRPGSALLHPDDVPAWSSILAEVRLLPDACLVTRLRVSHADGTTHWAEAQVRNLLDRRVHAIVVAWRDLTLPWDAASRTAWLDDDVEQRVATRTAELRALNQELQSFSYAVSHDLRAPLRTIEGFSQIMLEDYAGAMDERGVTYLRRIRAGARSMNERIEGLLELACVTRTELSRQSVDLGAMASSIVAELRERTPTRRVSFTVGVGTVADGDPRLLRVVLENLLGNAWKYTAGHSTACIEFGAVRRGDKLVYFVRDDGAGFDMRYASSLFMAFRRLHSSDQFEGTGLGLATVQRIIHRHGGRVWAESAVESGATFYFSLEP